MAILQLAAVVLRLTVQVLPWLSAIEVKLVELKFRTTAIRVLPWVVLPVGVVAVPLVTIPESTICFTKPWGGW